MKKRIEIRRNDGINILDASVVKSVSVYYDKSADACLCIGNFRHSFGAMGLQLYELRGVQLHAAVREIENFVYNDDKHEKLVVDVNTHKEVVNDGYCIVQLTLLHTLNAPPFVLNDTDISIDNSCTTTRFEIKVVGNFDSDADIIKAAKDKLCSQIGEQNGFDDAQITKRVPAECGYLFVRTYYPQNN